MSYCTHCFEVVCECADLDKVEKAAQRKKPVGESVRVGIGRGPTGKLRNYGAMTDEKLLAVAQQVADEGADAEAIATINTHLEQRGYMPVFTGALVHRG